jgi:hypothetical protein
VFGCDDVEGVIDDNVIDDIVVGDGGVVLPVVGTDVGNDDEGLR